MKLSNKLPKKIGFLLVLAILLGGFLRFYKLDQHPIHLGHDEVTQLYDAISITQTGKDIYGRTLPFIFQSVNDYKPPFYTYVTVVSYLFFGWQEMTIRIPGALFGTLLIPIVYFFVKKFWQKEGLALSAAFLTAIAPFEIFYARKSFENQTGILFMLLGFTLLRKRWRWGIAFLAFSSYVYFSQAVLVPILLAAFYLIFWSDLKKVFLKSLILFLLLSAPLYYIIATNPDARNRSRAVFITQDPVLGGKLSQEETFLGKSLIFTTYSSQRYLQQFNPHYLFLEGLDLTEGRYDVGPLYLVAAPFLAIGVFSLLQEREKKRENLFVLAWVLIGFVPSGLTFEFFSPHRAIMSFTMLNIVAAAGVYWFYRKFGNFALLVLLLLFGANLLFFIKRYTVNFPIERSEAIHYPYEEVARFAWKNHEIYEQIIFDPKFGQFHPWIGTGAHYYLGFFGQFPPKAMQAEFRTGDLDKRETKFDKFSIRAVYWPEDMVLEKTLIIASPWSLPIDIQERAEVIEKFYFKSTALAFYAIKL